MNKCKFHYLAARNFKCFGEEGIEIDFNNFGNIVLIRGTNLDNKCLEEDNKTSSNGVGKSSVFDILVYALFGKTIKYPKKITHKDVINNQIKKGLYVEVQLDNLKIIRTRKPDGLRVWESDKRIWDDTTEITKGSTAETQKDIEDRLKLNYDTFINLAVFTDNNSSSFLECDTPTKREIVENILSLGVYREYLTKAKKYRDNIKDKISLIVNSYEHILAQKASCKDRMEAIEKKEKQWTDSVLIAISELKSNINSKEKEFNSTDFGVAFNRYQEIQQSLDGLEKELKIHHENQVNFQSLMDKALIRETDVDKERIKVSQEIEQTEKSIKDINYTIDKYNKMISDLEGRENTQCPSCYGIVNKQNYQAVIQQSQNKIDSLRVQIVVLEKELPQKIESRQKLIAKLQTFREAVTSVREKLTVTSNRIKFLLEERNKWLAVEKPEKDKKQLIIEQQIEELKKRLVDKEKELKGKTPYTDILQTAKEELSSKEKESVKKQEELLEYQKKLPYCDFWIKAFGDDGIRKIVIDDVIPILNNQVAYWLQILTEGKISLKFDNTFEETIERNPPDGDPFVYWNKSGGERRKLNLSIAPAFAYIAMLNSGVMLSLLFLDEVSSNIDPLGVVAVYNMILELSKERQVFITTHDHDLLGMLSGCDCINLVKKEGVSKVIN